MSPKSTLRHVGLSVLGLFGGAAWSAAAAEPPVPAAATPAPAATAAPASATASPAAASVLLLYNGRMIEGVVSEDGADFVLRTRLGAVRFPKTQVEKVFGSVAEIYDYKRSQIPDGDPDEHLKLARWCLSQNLSKQAKQELTLVVNLAPKSTVAKSMLASIEASEARATMPKGDGALVQTAARDGGGDDRVQRPEELDPSLLRQAQRALGVPAVPVIFDLPAPVAVKRAEHFARFVHPVLQSSCVKCHNEKYSGEFQLVEVKSQRRASPEALRANLDATLKFIDRDNPVKSELLTTTLMPHGSATNRPIFRGSNDPRFQILSAWVTSLRPVTREPADALTRTRLAPGGGNAAGSGGGFASERAGNPPLPFDATPPGASADAIPSNIRREDLYLPPSRAVPGRGMVAEGTPPSAGDFPLPFAVSGVAPPKPGAAKPGAPAGAPAPQPVVTPMPGAPGVTPPGTLPELPATAVPPGGEAPEADAKATRPKKPLKLDPSLLEKALMNRNGGR